MFDSYKAQHMSSHTLNEVSLPFPAQYRAEWIARANKINNVLGKEYNTGKSKTWNLAIRDIIEDSLTQKQKKVFAVLFWKKK